MRKVIFAVVVLVLVGVLFFLYKSYANHTKTTLNSPPPSGTMSDNSGKMKITSSAFEDHKTIPTLYTCDGKSISPPLQFSDVPQNAKSLVLLMDDPDVPKNLKPDGVFDHWVVYNIPSQTTWFEENATPPGDQGLNGTGQNKYTGPCPPDREHRYFFKLFALDTMLDFDGSGKPDKRTVEEKMQGHIIDRAELVGVYNRKK